MRRQVASLNKLLLTAFSALTMFVAVGCATAENPKAEQDDTATEKATAEAKPLEIIRTVKHGEGVVETHFDNGLILISKENYSTDVVSVRAYVRVGSIYEGTNLGSGISHYFEHVISGGTTSTRTEAESKDLVSSIGNNTNAYTTRDHTAYYITTEAKHAKTASELIGDYLSNCLVDDNEFQRERGVIIQEIRKNKDNPGNVIYQLLAETMFPDHPAGQPVIGHLELFKKVTRDQLFDLYKRYYVSNNTVVSIVGALSHDEAAKIVAETFANYKRGIPNHPTMPEVPRQMSTRWAEKTSPFIRNTYMMMGHHTVSLDHPDLYALDVASEILGSGRTSRLHKALREKGLVQGVYSFSHTPDYNAGVFAIGAQFEDARTGEVLGVILDEITKLKTGGVTREEINSAVRRMTTSHIFGQESAESQASDIGTNYMSTGNPNFTKAYLDNLKMVTPEDITRVVKKYLTDENRTVALLRPEKKKPAEADNQKNTPEAKGKERAKAETISKRPEVEKFTLKNGLRVIYGKDANVGSVHIQLTGLGGVLAETPENNGVCRLMTTMLLQGTKLRDKNKLNNDVEAIGAKLYSGSGNNSWYIGIKVLPEDFNSGLDTLSEIILQPLFGKDDFDRELAVQTMRRMAMEDSWSAESSAFFRKSIFGDHPYALNPLGSPESLKGMTIEKMKKYFGKNVNAENCVLTVFGNIERSKVEELAEKVFMTMPLPSERFAIPAEEQPVDNSKPYLKQNTKGQVVLTYGYPGVEFAGADLPALQVLDTVISGYGYPSGWLHSALRGEADLVYLVHAFNWTGLGTGVFEILTQTSPENVEEVMTRIDAVLERARTEEVSDEELERAKEIIVISDAIQTEVPQDRALQYAYDELYGAGYRFSESSADKIRAVTKEDVLRVAKKYLKSGVVTATGPEAGLDNVKKYFETENNDK